MAPEYVSSNVVNFLVWRYLEEAGYHKAATHLRRSWLEKADPETVIPFAPRIARNALISLIQDGLFLDNLQSEAKNLSPQYIFGSDHGPKYASQKGEEPNPRKRRRPEPRHRVDVEAETELTEDSRPARVKGKGKSVSRASRVNGETTDVETNGAVQAQPTEPAAEDVETPAEVEEDIAPIIETLAIGSSRETEPKRSQNLLPGTTFFGANSDRSPLSIVTFNPVDPRQLVLAGNDSMTTVYAADHPVNDRENDYVIPDDLIDGQVVGMFTWIGDGEAIIEVFQPRDGDKPQSTQSRLMRVTDGGSDLSEVALVNGPVISLQYQQSTNELLCLSGGERSTVNVWELSPYVPELRLQKRADIPLFDLALIGERRFVGAGPDVVGCWTYTVHGTMQTVHQPVPVPWQSTGTRFGQLRVSERKHDAAYVAVLAEENHELAVIQVDSEFSLNSFGKSRIFDSAILEFDFSRQTPGLLATLSEDGSIHIWTSATFSAASTPLSQLSMGAQNPAITFAFPPLGDAIAAAGFNTLMIFELSEEQYQSPDDAKAKWIWPEGDSKWLSVPEEGDGREWTHKLSWSADGRKIAFVLDEQTAIIRYGTENVAMAM